jgi:3-methyladenine DNA glycosylase Tag
MAPNEKKWVTLDTLLMLCDRHGTRRWTKETFRRARPPNRLLSDIEMMKIIATAIAYSQGARSQQVFDLIQSGVFGSAFAGFDAARLSRLDPEVIIQRHWRDLGCVRFKGKVRRIVECAQTLKKIAADFGSFARYLASFDIPRSIRTKVDVELFWKNFDSLRHDLYERKMPFFSSTTSLLQLLLDLGYDPVKPDLIVMRFARRIGLVEKETGDANLRSVVRQTQAYALDRGLRTSVVDLAILAFGGQTGARGLLRQRFCPPSDPCRHQSCDLGQKSVCNTFER